MPDMVLCEQWRVVVAVLAVWKRGVGNEKIQG